MKILLLTPVVLLAGCATSLDPNYKAFLEYKMAAPQKPIMELRAQPGQTVELRGVEALVVYSNDNQQGQVMQRQPNEWAGVWSKAIGVLGTYLGITAAGQATVDLANAVGNHSRGSNVVNYGNYQSEVGNSNGSNLNSNLYSSFDSPVGSTFDSPVTNTYPTTNTNTYPTTNTNDYDYNYNAPTTTTTNYAPIPEVQ